jgi:hypothetical protein
MTERKPGLPSFFRRPDAGNVPSPWVPPEPPAVKHDRTASPPAPRVPAELPASAAKPAAAKHDRTTSPLVPWVPAELPASTAAPAALASDRKITKRKPWVPPPEAPRDLQAAAADGDGTKTPELQPGERRPAEPAPAQNTGPAIQQTIIVQQVAAPAPVYVTFGCPRLDCARYAGRICWRVYCWWW